MRTFTTMNFNTYISLSLSTKSSIKTSGKEFQRVEAFSGRKRW